MILKNDNIDAVVDAALGINIAMQEKELRWQVIEQLFEVRNVYDGLSYDEYELRPYNPAYIIGLSESDRAGLKYILERYFMGVSGVTVDIKNNGCVHILSDKN